MDIQKEVDKILIDLKELDETKIKNMIGETIIKIKKQKNVKLFYKLLINKIEKKIIAIANITYDDNLENNVLLLKKYSNINNYLKEEYELFKKQYIEEKAINNDTVKINNQKYKYESTTENTLKIDISSSIKEKIYNDLVNNIKKDDYEINDIIIAFTKYLNNINIVSDIEELNKLSDELYNRLYEYLYENKSIFFEFSYLIDVLSSIYKNYDKESKERNLLKPMYKKYTTLYKIYKTKIAKNEINPYFDIIDYWLSNENDYLYLKELVNRNQKIRNSHSNGEHIVIYILKKYIDNFKKMIVNDDYTNINYLREVYYLFTKSYYLRLTKDEKNTIDTIIKEFSVYIKNTLIKERRKNAALNDLKSMKTNTFYPQRQEYDFRENTIDELTYDKRRVYNNSISSIKEKNATETFLISNYAYNIAESEDEINLKMYTFNIGNYIMDNSIINLELEKCEFTKEKIDEFISREFDFEVGQIYPTICYQLKFYKSGKIKSLDISRENIEIKDKITTFDVEKMGKFYDLYKKSIVKNVGIETDYNLLEINKHFENILNNEFVKFIKENRLPFIYYGYTLPTIEEINENMNALAPFLHNIDKDVAYEIINIVSSKIDKKHYSLFPIENAEYDLKLINSFNYIGILNQKMLNDIYFNDYNFETEERKNREKKSRLIKFYKITKELNDSFNYIDVSEIKESKGKIKRRFKI